MITPEEVEFALATNGQSLQAKVMFALIAHLIVEPDGEERGTGRSGVAAAAENTGSLAGNTSAISLAEALYYDLGHISIQSTSSIDPQHDILVTDQDIRGIIARGGIDYRF